MWISSIDAISSRAEKFLNCFLHSLQLNSLSCRLVVVVVLGMTVFMTRLCKNSSLRGISQIIILRNFFFSPLFLAQKFKVSSLFTISRGYAFFPVRLETSDRVDCSGKTVSSVHVPESFFSLRRRRARASERYPNVVVGYLLRRLTTLSCIIFLSSFFPI
jgi:hypothetical protein